MSSKPPEDQNVKELVQETKEIATDVPKATAAVKADIFEMETEIQKAFPGTQLAIEVSAISKKVATGLTEADAAAAGILRLIKQLGFPLSIVGGVKLQGTGAIAVVAGGVRGELLNGVKYAMTHRQVIVSDIAGGLTLLTFLAGIIGQLYPAFLNFNLLGAASVGVAIQGLKSVIIPRLNRYADTKDA
jgi:hypothetical protein